MPPPVFKDENLNEIVKNSLNLHADMKPSIRRESRLGSSVPLLLLDREKIQQVLINIIKNALEAMGRKGNLKISTEFRKEENEVEIRVKDSGPGIEEETLSKIFLPYFSTKDTGTGLGLAICRRIITDHDGLITAESSPGKGTTFIIILPGKETQ